jgi:hypothetical protein
MGVLLRQITAYMSQGGLFANGIWASRKPGANVSVSLLIASVWRLDGGWREVAATRRSCAWWRLGSCYGRIILPCRAIVFATKAHSLTSAASAGARDCASADVLHCNLKLLEPNEPVMHLAEGDDNDGDDGVGESDDGIGGDAE